MELEDADLLDYDKDDALSTVHEVGLEEDLEDPEIQDSLQVQPEVIELTNESELPAPQGVFPPPSPTEATKDIPQGAEPDPMEESEGVAPQHDIDGRGDTRSGESRQQSRTTSLLLQR